MEGGGGSGTSVGSLGVGVGDDSRAPRVFPFRLERSARARSLFLSDLSLSLSVFGSGRNKRARSRRPENPRADVFVSREFVPRDFSPGPSRGVSMRRRPTDDGNAAAAAAATTLQLSCSQCRAPRPCDSLATRKPWPARPRTRVWERPNGDPTWRRKHEDLNGRGYAR